MVEQPAPAQRAGRLTTVETHRPPRGGKGGKKGKKGVGVSDNLKEDQRRVKHMKGREGGSPGKEKRVVISKGAQYHNPDAVT